VDVVEEILFSFGDQDAAGLFNLGLDGGQQTGINRALAGSTGIPEGLIICKTVFYTDPDGFSECICSGRQARQTGTIMVAEKSWKRSGRFRKFPKNEMRRHSAAWFLRVRTPNPKGWVRGGGKKWRLPAGAKKNHRRKFGTYSTRRPGIRAQRNYLKSEKKNKKKKNGRVPGASAFPCSVRKKESLIYRRGSREGRPGRRWARFFPELFEDGSSG